MNQSAAVLALTNISFWRGPTSVPLPLIDDRVAAAAAATKHLEHAKVADHVAALLKCTPPEHADQHSGLTPLMRFACTAMYNDPMPPEVRMHQAHS